MRHDGGRPPDGACARIEDESGEILAEAAILLVVRREPEDEIAHLAHIVRRTNDPAERYKKGLELLSETYYQQSREFSDVLTGLFGAQSPLALRLLRAGRCTLHFGQHQQSYSIPCSVTEVGRDHKAWQATYWHNAIFNADIPPDIRVLLFKPKWVEATAEPPPY